jgi:sialic acid synthase SpsE
LGAAVIEKHFTLDRKLPGPDHRASLEPGELKELVSSIRSIEKALGSPIKKPSGEEIQNRKISRRSLFAAMDIPQGTVITADMLDAKRPGTGVSPKCFRELVGREAISTIEEDELITWDKVR